MQLIDSHAHLTHARLLPEVDDVLARARGAGVDLVVSIASHLEDAQRAVVLAEATPGVYATAGIHPHHADLATSGALAGIAELARAGRVVAVGETGLDFHYDNAPRADQLRSFGAQLELGAETGLPVVVHARSADREVRDLLAGPGRGTRGVLHCFSSGRELLRAALDLGWSISFSGLITFPSWHDHDLLREVPDDRILVETDAPYLAPVPHRGGRNEPAHVVEVARAAAAIRGAEPAAFAAVTTANARALFGMAA